MVRPPIVIPDNVDFSALPLSEDIEHHLGGAVYAFVKRKAFSPFRDSVHTRFYSGSLIGLVKGGWVVGRVVR
jgi:hypothetical protein